MVSFLPIACPKNKQTRKDLRIQIPYQGIPAVSTISTYVKNTITGIM
jgi:hypothetical protein